jgi:GxxExxY protein
MLTDDRRDPQTYAIIGAAMEVHSQLGSGFLEAVYQQACAVEFGLRQIPFAREVLLVVEYKSVPLDCRYKADFICFGEVLVEFKALNKVTTTEMAQLLNYLKATGLKRGLLINFGGASLQHQRIVHDYKV